MAILAAYAIAASFSAVLRRSLATLSCRREWLRSGLAIYVGRRDYITAGVTITAIAKSHAAKISS